MAVFSTHNYTYTVHNICLSYTYVFIGNRLLLNEKLFKKDNVFASFQVKIIKDLLPVKENTEQWLLILNQSLLQNT